MGEGGAGGGGVKVRGILGCCGNVEEGSADGGV